MSDTIVIWAMVGIIAITSYLGGRYDAGRHSRALAKDLASVNMKLDMLAELATMDPMRAGINSGARFVLSELERLVVKLEKDLP